MQWDQKLAVSSKLFVNLKTPLRNSTIRGCCTRKSCPEERQSFPSIVAHGDTSRWHNCHERIQSVMRKTSRRILPSGVTLQVSNIVSGCPAEYAIRKARRHENSGQESKRFVAVHKPTLIFFRCLLCLQYTSDAPDNRKGNNPVVNGGCIIRRNRISQSESNNVFPIQHLGDILKI